MPMYTVADLDRIRVTIAHAEGWIEHQHAKIAHRTEFGHDAAAAELFWLKRMPSSKN